MGRGETTLHKRHINLSPYLWAEEIMYTNDSCHSACEGIMSNSTNNSIDIAHLFLFLWISIYISNNIAPQFLNPWFTRHFRRGDTNAPFFRPVYQAAD